MRACVHSIIYFPTMVHRLEFSGRFTENRGLEMTMNRPTVAVDFCDFGIGYDKTNNFFYNLLKERFQLRICDQPDFLIYSDFGHLHRLHTCTKIFFTGESTRPNFDECDYAISSSYLDDPRHLRLPFYVHYGGPEDLIKQPNEAEQILARKTKFCAFIVSGHNPRKNRNRVEFFQRLSRYKRVDSGGRYLNNIGGPVAGYSTGKVEFLKQYKFNICFENASVPGYTTEKIFEAMRARCLPIYWGNRLVGREFNTRSFLNFPDFASEEALIERIIELDKADTKYLEYARQPYFADNKPNEFFSRERILEFFGKVFSTKITPVSSRHGWSAFGRWTLAKRHRPRPQT